jgi:hypothetical protein
LSQRGEGAHSVGEDRLHSPAHCHLHLGGIVDRPDANLLAGLSALLQEFLALLAHEQSKVDGESITGVPEVCADNIGRKPNMIPAEKG